MNAALELAPRLALERLRGTRGGAALDLLAVAAFTVSAWLTMTVTGGTWMFVARWQHPGADMLARLQLPARSAASYLESYVVLATIACALLVLPVLTLGAAAARLGARGRARRLASLRLVGMTGGEVVLMSVVETLVQALLGTALGVGLWLLTLPSWRLVSFHGGPIAPGEMLLPWWLALAVVVVLLGLAALSTVLGLQQVRISPLGVAMQQTPRRLRAWRVAVFVVALVAFAIFGRLFSSRVGLVDLQIYAVMAGMILFVVGAVNLVGPWVLQLLARPGVLTGNAARLIAMRRIVDDPRAAWRNVSAVALLGMIAAFVAMMPTDRAFLGDDAARLILAADMRTGVLVTLAIGLLVGATSTLVNQAALVVDRSDEAVALDRAGYPRALFARIRRHHVLAPLVITLVASIGVGLLLATPFMSFFRLEASGVALMLGTVVVGLALTIGAAEACRPLQRTVLTQAHRRND